MDRDVDRPERETASQVGRQWPTESPDARADAIAPRDRELVRDRGRIWRVSEAELKTMYEIGRFRTVAIEDLLRHQYNGQALPMQQDLRSLAAQGLIQRRGAWIRRKKATLEVVVLTRSGKGLLERNRPERSTQEVYAGFVKPSEVAHDAAIYRMYHAESGRLERQGGVVKRVVLDYELKRKVYSPLAKARTLPAAEYAKRRLAVAQEHGLKVVRGRIVLPDLRIEYQTRDGDSARVDLELATEHYHGSHMRAKAEAGFRFYVADGSAGRLSRVLEDREITASILSL